MRSLVVTVVQLDRQHWRVEFELQAPRAQLRVPPPAAAQRRDGLWQHLCGELFVASEGGRYAEFNFAPSGDWAAYLFDGWRRHPRPAVLDFEPRVELAEASVQRLGWAAEFTLPPELGAPLRIAPCVVVELAAGEHCYWAVAHGAAQPDFHREESFVPWVNE